MNDKKRKLKQQKDKAQKRLKRETKCKSPKPTNTISDQEFARQFEDFQHSIRLGSCDRCNRAFFNLKIETEVINGKTQRVCKDCKSDNNLRDNNLDPGEIPEELRKLTFVEELLIALNHPIVSVYKIKNNQYGYRGNIITFPQDISSMAKALPHSIETISKYIIVRRKQCGNFIDFIVNSERLRNALKWLKKNNPFYREIEISQDNLNRLPKNGSVLNNILEAQKCNLAEENDSDSDSEQPNEQEKEEYPNTIYMSGAASINFQNIEQNVKRIIQNQPVIDAPTIESNPVNEFSSPGFIVKAFPTLFPFGRGDLHESRRLAISPNEYFKYLMLYKDGRFRNHPRFAYFAMNCLFRWQALKNASICIRKNSALNQINDLDNLKKFLSKNESAYNSILSYNSNLRSTSSYWKSRTRELLQMIKIIGVPTIFFTLSAADIQWPELNRLYEIEQEMQLIDESAQNRLRNKKLNSEPMTAAYFFNERVNFFVKKIIVPKFGAIEYWFRVEFQHRGSPHIHGFLWLPNRPSIDIKPNETEKIKKLKDYFDNLIHAKQTNPTIHYNTHPSKQHYSETIDDPQNLDQLIKAVQTHKCTKSYCQKNNSCRFKFPKELTDESRLEFIDDVLTYFPARNNAYINQFNEFVIKLWRANIDFQPVTNPYLIAQYITKYITKAEKSSKGFQEFLNEVMAEAGDSTVKKIIQKILLKTPADRDYSFQEVCYILMGWNLYSSSRTFETINLSDEIWTNIEINEDQTITKKNSIQNYINRPSSFENETIISFLCKYYKNSKRSNQYSTRKKPAIPIIYPYIKFIPNSDNESYYKMQVLMKIPWRKIEDLKPENLTWEEVYQNLPSTSQNDQNFPIDNEVSEEEEMEVEQSGPDWCILSSTNPNNPISSTPCLGQRAIDETHDWNAAFNKYSEAENLVNFIDQQKSINNESSTSSQSNDLGVPFDKLSKPQQEVLKCLDKQIAFLQRTKSSKPPHQCVLIYGKAGSGKSTVAKHIQIKLSSAFEMQSYLVMAPTGIAAVNIEGATIHSTLKISVDNDYTPLNHSTLKELQENFRNINFIIVDELSMVGSSLLRKMDLRLREAKPEQADQPFGGIFVYFFGDFKQLPPTFDPALYSKQNSNALSKEGQILYETVITKCFFFENSFRQSNQEKFIKILDSIADGKLSEEDYAILNTRLISNVPTSERDSFNDAIYIYATKEKTEEHNRAKLAKKCSPGIIIKAINSCELAQNSSTDEAKGLENSVFVSLGCKIMLRHNFWVEKGLANGSLGKVIDIIFKPNTSPPDDQPLVLMCKFDNYTGPTVNGLVPIPAITRFFQKSGKNVNRKQFPVQPADAINIHKTQGLTIPKAFIDIGPREFAAGLTYVALSRLRKLEDLILLMPYSLDRFTEKISKKTIVKERILEERRLHRL